MTLPIWRQDRAAREAREARARALVARIDALPKEVTLVAFFARAGYAMNTMSRMRLGDAPKESTLSDLEDTLDMLEREKPALFVARAERCASIAAAVEARERGGVVHAADRRTQD